jgi:hypothetical protein
MLVNEVLDVEGEEVTCQEWTDNKIVAQTAVKLADWGDDHTNLADSDDDLPPLLTNSEVLCAITELDQLFRVSNENEFADASRALKKVAWILQ